MEALHGAAVIKVGVINVEYISWYTKRHLANTVLKHWRIDPTINPLMPNITFPSDEQFPFVMTDNVIALVRKKNLSPVIYIHLLFC